jgi:hypothetical protein
MVPGLTGAIQDSREESELSRIADLGSEKSEEVKARNSIRNCV